MAGPTNSIAEFPPMTLDDITASDIVLRPDFFIPIDGEEPTDRAGVSVRSRAFSATIAWVVEYGDTQKDLIRDDEGVCMGLTLNALTALHTALSTSPSTRKFGARNAQIVGAVLDDHLAATDISL